MISCVLGLLAVLAAPPAARADDAAMTRFHYEQATRYYASGRYEDAVQHFFIAQRISPNPRTVYNIGLCFLQLRRQIEAFHFLSEYLSMQDDADGAADRRAFAQRNVQAISPQIARVRVESEPSGARIFVDQTEHGAWGTTPRVLALSPGPHRIWVELDGHRRAEVEPTAVRGQEVVVTLRPEQVLGTIRVTSAVPGSVRVIDPGGRTVSEGPAPLSAVLPPGSYEVEVAAAGYRSNRRLVAVVADTTNEAAVELERLPPRRGTVTVTADVPNAAVQLDGAPVGFTPLPAAALDPGSHNVVVTAPGMLPWEGSVDVELERQLWVRVEMEEEPRGRSPATWALGGAGIALIVAGSFTGGYALAGHDDFAQRHDALDAGDLRGARRRGRGLGLATDVLLGVGLASLSAAVVLFFATDDSRGRESTATVSQGER